LIQYTEGERWKHGNARVGCGVDAPRRLSRCRVRMYAIHTGVLLRATPFRVA